MVEKSMTYAGVGVDYDAMDPFKRLAQKAGRETAGNLKRFGMSELEMSRGESAYLIETPDGYLAHVEEGLGTKNLVADAMYKLTGKSYYDQIAQDTVAMIVNDLLTLGALPISVAMHLAVGDSDWFKDENRVRDLVNGWRRACDLAHCAWGGGETPTLKGIVVPDAAVLAGSAMGLVKPKHRLIEGNIREGHEIILLESSGIHANGLTMARKIADRLPEGYLTKLPDGRTFGATLLDPTHIYVEFLTDCHKALADIRYAVNVTGHGWRKLMRAPEPFAYMIEQLPPVPPIFDFIQKYGPVDDREAYGNFNMGAGFALIVPRANADLLMDIHSRTKPPFRAFRAGYVRRSDTKKVVIEPKGLVYDADTLAVR